MGLVIETGEARKVHDFCCLAGYGAEAVNPYLAFDTLSKMLEDPDNEMLDVPMPQVRIELHTDGLGAAPPRNAAAADVIDAACAAAPRYARSSDASERRAASASAWACRAASRAAAAAPGASRRAS